MESLNYQGIVPPHGSSSLPLAPGYSEGGPRTNSIMTAKDPAPDLLNGTQHVGTVPTGFKHTL